MRTYSENKTASRDGPLPLRLPSPLQSEGNGDDVGLFISVKRKRGNGKRDDCCPEYYRRKDGITIGVNRGDVALVIDKQQLPRLLLRDPVAGKRARQTARLRLDHG